MSEPTGVVFCGEGLAEWRTRLGSWFVAVELDAALITSQRRRSACSWASRPSTAINSYFEWYEGDSTPGLRCASGDCGVVLNVPADVEIEWV